VKTTTGRDCSKKMGLQRERESTNKVHKKLPLLKEEKETKGKKRKTFF
jgi:hypothetical protein